MAHQDDSDTSAPSSPTEHNNNNKNGAATQSRTPLVDPTIYPGNSRSISAIALHALCLGIVFASCSIATILLAHHSHRIWRLAEFIATLSLFHFLEFWTTARYNTHNAKVSSYLLTSNGGAYLSAHVAAMVEIIITSFFFPALQDAYSNIFTITAGAVLVIMGQVIRSTAMAQAGVSFNHIPAKSKKNDHVLVTSGLYSWFRHPSYFGYYFFAVGTQVVVGNKICFVSYAIILWFFFKDRITHEEQDLVKFFGDDYLAYRKSVGTGIPFIP
ncbi:protein-S-isoprenylcysteine O-methyltransferase [Aureobasidium namibiae CBS 147.97]|uniref:Protein-S-isoprenylcysteine O-methyltransferase n=1 Tax=Aureobasidium namibiae CBS 147.97 TaxID=1043004 RepID=A0A074WD28_9PEZI